MNTLTSYMALTKPRLLPLVLFSGLPAFSPAGWFAVVFLGIGGGAMQFGLWIWAVSKLTPTQAAIYLTLTPVTAVLLASLILGEPVSLGLFAGLALVVGSILLANRPARSPS